MGEKQNQPFQLSFNSSLKVDFQGSRVTSDGGLLLVREFDERLGLSALIAANVIDDRRGKNTQFTAAGSAQTVHLQSLGTVRGSERYGAAVARSDVPLHRPGEDLGSWVSVAFAPALVRDRGAEPRPEHGRSGPNQSGTDCQGGGYGFTPAGGAEYGQHGNSGLRRTGGECLQRAF